MQRGDRHRLAQPEVPQPVGLGLGALVVHLVRREYDGLAGLAQDPDDGLVVVGDPDPGVDHEQHRVGDVHRDLGLRADALGQPARVGVPAAGVDDGEGAAVPDGVVGDAVAGDAGDVLDHGLAAADDPVDQRRLAHVGAADDGQDRARGCRWCSVGGAHALFFSRLGPSGPGKVMPVVSLGGADGLQDRVGDAGGGVGHVLLGARPGLAAEVDRLAEGHRDAGAPRRERAVGAAGQPGAEERHRHDGRTGDQGEVGRPGARRGHVAGPARALGEHADGVARRAGPARATRIAATSTWKRSSGICPTASRNAPSGPSNISCLVRACTGRGAQIASSGPSSQPTWLAAITTGPVVGHVLGAVDLEVPPRADDAPAGRSVRWSAARCAERVRRRSRAALHRRCGEPRSWLAPRPRSLAARRLADERRPPGRRPRRGCTAWCRGARPRRASSPGRRRGRSRSGRGGAGRPGSPRRTPAPFSAVRRAARADGSAVR